MILTGGTEDDDGKKRLFGCCAGASAGTFAARFVAVTLFAAGALALEAARFF
jgi:hypothetical protein